MSIEKLQRIRKQRSQVASERHELKAAARRLRAEERDAKNSVLHDYLEAGNFESTHAMVRRIKPSRRSSAPESLRQQFDEWLEECRVYDAAKKRLIDQKVSLLYTLQNMDKEDYTKFLSINFGKRKD